MLQTIFVFCSSGERTETDQHTSINLLPSLPLVDKGTPQTPSPWRSNRNPDLRRGGWWPRSAPDRRPISYKKIKDQIEKMINQISGMPSDKMSNQTENQNAKNGERKCEKWRKIYLWQVSRMASGEVLVIESCWWIDCWTVISSWYRRNTSWYCSASDIRTPTRWFWHQTSQVYCRWGN